MILCSIADSARYRAISPRLAIAIDWVTAHAFEPHEPGRIDIDPAEGIYANVERVAMMPREKAHLEAHRRYIDIHVPVRNDERMGWSPVESLRTVHAPYNEERDVMFYGDDAASLLRVRVGQMAIFFTDDAHAPNIGLGNHNKICVKIPVG